MKKLKRFIAGAFVMLLLLNQGMYAVAAPTSDQINTYLEAADLRIQEIRALNGDTVTTQYNLIRRLGCIVEVGMYVEFIRYAEASLGYADSNSFETYAEKFYSDCASFNSKFGDTNATAYKGLKLGVTETAFVAEDVNTYIQNTLASVFEEYLTALLNSIAAENLDERELGSNYGTSLGAMVEILDNLESDCTQLNNWKTSTDTYLGIADKVSQTIEGIRNNTNYATLLSVGVTYQKHDATDSLHVDTSLTFVENLANVQVNALGILEVDTDPKLSLNYIAILAASSVYEPLVSYTGNSAFMEALSSLYEADEVTDIKLLYDSTKSYKKPLYKRELDSTGQPTGKASLITVSEFLDDISNGNTGALCTAYGTFNIIKDIWAYIQTSKIQVDSFGNVIEKVTDTNTSDQLDGAGVDNSNEGDSAGGTASIKDELLSMFDRTVYAAVSDGFPDVDESETEVGTTGGDTIFAYKTITSENAMMDSVLVYGAKYARSIDNMTTMILTNILQSSHTVSSIKNADSRYLYINAYGDIVLDDDLVILPGAANPIIYSKGQYNPFTVAFMNNYPSIIKNTSYFKLASKSDIGKYLVFGNYDSDIENVNNFQASKTTAIDTVEVNGPLKMPTIETSFTSNSGLDSLRVFKTRKLLFNSGEEWENEELQSFTPLLNSATITINGATVFPYVQKEDANNTVACAIVENMFTYLAVDKDTHEVGNTENLNDGYLLSAFLISGLNGSNNVEAYEDDMMLSYESYTEDATNRKIDTIVDVSTSIYNNTTDVSGVIGIKSIYDNKIVGTILNLFRDNLLIFFFLIVVVILFLFSKAHFDILQSIAFTAIGVIVSYLFIAVLPDLLPGLFNIVTNNVSQNLTYEILALDAEHFSVDDGISELNSEGYMDLQSTSMTLYKATGLNRIDFTDGLGVESSDLIGGNTVNINRSAGVFAKGTEIKVNTNILFDTLEIEGEVNSSNAYTVTAHKTVSSNIDYYVPYYQIVDCFIDKINSISEIYSIPRKTTTYANGTVKNSYLVYSYVNSKPFVTPGNYDYVDVSSEMGWTDEERNAYKTESANISKRLYSTFDSNADWIGISNFLYNLDEASRKTLWAGTLRDLGYYDENWTANTEKMDALVSYVNYQTKKFVYDMSSQIGYLSDDVMIKTIAVRALIALTQKASDLGHWMYPYSVSYEDMSLKDVLRSVFINDYDKYVDLDMDVMTYIENEHGWFNLIVFDALIVAMFITTNLLNQIVPIFYMAFGILMLYKAFTATGIKDALKGYIKSSIIIIICSTIMTFGVIGARAMNGNVMAIYFLLLVTIVVLIVLAATTISVITNFAEFGNTSMNLKAGKFISLFKDGGNGRHSIQKNKMVSTRNLVYRKQHQKTPARRAQQYYDRYNINANVEDFYAQRHDSAPYRDYADTEPTSIEVEELTRDEETQEDVVDIL